MQSILPTLQQKPRNYYIQTSDFHRTLYNPGSEKPFRYSSSNNCLYNHGVYINLKNDNGHTIVTVLRTKPEKYLLTIHRIPFYICEKRKFSIFQITVIKIFVHKDQLRK